MSRSETLVVSSAQELLPHADLVSITTMAISGERLAPAATSSEVEFEQETAVSVRKEPQLLEVRLNAVVKSVSSRISTDISATYSLDVPVDIPDAVVTEFVERVAAMAIVPFVRESVMTTATRLGVDVPILGLVRQGEFHLEPRSSE